MKCKSLHGIKRLIGCDSNSISKDAVRNGFDQAFAVSNSPFYGGSGGSVPVITSSDQTPVSMIAHEYMHTLGFGDEYSYSAGEAKIYCKTNYIKKWINLTIIRLRSGGYTDDGDAREKHNWQIPWYNKIENTTPIYGGSLGTPAKQNSKIGLFKAQSCSKAIPRIYAWKPGHKTIMEFLNAPVGVLEGFLTDALRSSGARFKAGISSPPPGSLTLSESHHHPCSHSHNHFHGPPILDVETKENMLRLQKFMDGI